jgi:hypothetical protein
MSKLRSAVSAVILFSPLCWLDAGIVGAESRFSPSVTQFQPGALSSADPTTPTNSAGSSGITQNSVATKNAEASSSLPPSATAPQASGKARAHDVKLNEKTATAASTILPQAIPSLHRTGLHRTGKLCDAPIVAKRAPEAPVRRAVAYSVSADLERSGVPFDQRRFPFVHGIGF